MPDFQTRFERLEFKYLIDEFTARDIRAQIAPFCRPDVHSLGGAPDRPGGAGYTINSLYLDTPALAFHQAKERGDPNRIKLRVRTYSSTSPATLEIKRRRSEVIDKTRAVIDRSRVADAASGALLEPESAYFFTDFASIVAKAGASPKLTVRYEREAYESFVDDYARITFDRRIEVRTTPEWDLTPSDQGWCSFDEHWKTEHLTTPVVLEVKCQAACVPRWAIELVHGNALLQTGFSKYSIGIYLLQMRDGLRGVRSRAARALS